MSQKNDIFFWSYILDSLKFLSNSSIEIIFWKICELNYQSDKFNQFINIKIYDY